ncbi:hypothetical protein QCA50_011620 [Cerrena zonata]|uniref:Uncharacterized protein n=1 Tax=Cerrena zonata TaxID=2478898 RepID=A0AAW0G6F6_9APHY
MKHKPFPAQCRGGIILSFNGKESILVIPKPRAKCHDANKTVAERNAAKAAIVAEKLAKKAEKQARKISKTRKKKQNSGHDGTTDNVDVAET